LKTLLQAERWLERWLWLLPMKWKTMGKLLLLQRLQLPQAWAHSKSHEAKRMMVLLLGDGLKSRWQRVD
jgi:hypothetical protein